MGHFLQKLFSFRIVSAILSYLRLIFFIIVSDFFLFQSLVYSQSGWFQLNSGTNEYLKDLYFIDETTGYVGGSNNTLLKTTNGGLNWNNIYSNPILRSFNALYFFNNGTGLAGASYWPGPLQSFEILRTTNGGNNWSWVGYVPVSEFRFLNSNTGFALGWFMIGKTTNSGINWTVQNFNFNYQYYFNSIDFSDSLNVHVAGEDNYGGIILRSFDGGNTWTQTDSSLSKFYNHIRFISSNTGFIGLDRAFDKGLIVKATNGGNNWQEYITNYSSEFKSIQFLNTSTGYIIGRSVILKSTNAGQNWFSQQISFSGLNKGYFVNDSVGYAVGSNGLIIKTTNGGGPIGLQHIGNKIPLAFYLSQNYPNPFNPNTKIQIQISKFSYVKVVVYDVLGKESSTPVNQQLKPGTYEVDFDGGNLPSGVYFYSLFVDGRIIDTKKMMVTK